MNNRTVLLLPASLEKNSQGQILFLQSSVKTIQYKKIDYTDFVRILGAVKK
jgi:hypothetical protein